MIFILGGHNNKTASSTASGFRYDVGKATWSSSGVPDMQEPRKADACLYVELETTRGILVTGGTVLCRSQPVTQSTDCRIDIFFQNS